MGLKTFFGLKPPRHGGESGSNAKPKAPVETGRFITDTLLPPNFPIDVVYTWVDADDPRFQDRLSSHLPAGGIDKNTMSKARFQNHDELRYSLRSLLSFVPWVNHIYVVTCGQTPSWLVPNERLSLVDHTDILDEQYLPTFNSHVIGSALHRIAGLSEHYIYFNDDVLLLRPIEPGDAFTGNGLAYGFVGNLAISDTSPEPNETATNWGAKNARTLVARQWGRPLDRRFSHMFHPQRKTVAEECEAIFAAEYHSFRQNRFRAMDDLLCCSYLHPVAAYITGRGLFTRSSLWYVKIRDPSARKLYEQILRSHDLNSTRSVVCLNDIPTESELPGYGDHLHAFLSTYLPEPSCFESRRP